MYVCDKFKERGYLCKAHRLNAVTEEGSYIFTDEMLSLLGITDEYIDYFYKRYLSGDEEVGYALKWHLYFNGLNLLQSKINKERGVPYKFLYQWMEAFPFWDCPEIQQYKIYPDMHPVPIDIINTRFIIYNNNYKKIPFYNLYFKIKYWLCKVFFKENIDILEYETSY